MEGKEVRKKKKVWEKRGEEEGQTRRKGGEGWQREETEERAWTEKREKNK